MLVVGYKDLLQGKVMGCSRWKVLWDVKWEFHVIFADSDKEGSFSGVWYSVIKGVCGVNVMIISMVSQDRANVSYWFSLVGL